MDEEREYFAEHHARVREMLGDRTVAQFSELPLVERKHIFRQHLVQDERVIIEEGDDGNEMNPDLAYSPLLLQQFFMGDDDIGKQMVKEAREVYYGENEFWVRLHWLCEFKWNGLGTFDEARLPIAPLVRSITIETSLHDHYYDSDDSHDDSAYSNDDERDEERSEDPSRIRPSTGNSARRTRRRLEDLFLFTNAEKITLVLRGNGPLDGSDPTTRQTIADLSVTVKRLIDFFGNRFTIEKWPSGKPRPTRSLLSYWNAPTELTRRDIMEGRATTEQRMQVELEKWTRELSKVELPSHMT
ncbi:hypothetical protein EDB80DRAFT_735916 [Ilyonectria destructans]|nr:hypothetical protein EDB80DRAFT_735916 [Ilyonectria destructans]